MTEEEQWVTTIDFAGHRYLSGPTGRVRLYVDKNVLMLLDYEGKRNAPLAWLFLALPRVPLTRAAVEWEDELPPELLLAPAQRVLFDLVEPFAALARLRARSCFAPSEDALFVVETTLEHCGILASSAYQGLRLVSRFHRQRGLEALIVYGGNNIILELEQVTDHAGE